MNLVRAVGRVIFWRYQRGSWQYDILCGVILVFIFLTPKEVFDGSLFVKKEKPFKEEQRVSDVSPESVTSDYRAGTL